MNIFSFKKYKVYWGDFSIVKSTVFLLKTALEKKYDRYMIISGSDIPLITNQSIYEFFKNNENEYIDCAEMPISGWVDNGGFDRIDYYYPKIYNRGSSVLFQRFFSKVLCQINQKIIIPILKKIKIHRKHIENIKYYGGSEWMDLTGNCVSQIISC